MFWEKFDSFNFFQYNKIWQSRVPQPRLWTSMVTWQCQWVCCWTEFTTRTPRRTTTATAAATTSDGEPQKWSWPWRAPPRWTQSSCWPCPRFTQLPWTFNGVSDSLNFEKSAGKGLRRSSSLYWRSWVFFVGQTCIKSIAIGCTQLHLVPGSMKAIGQFFEISAFQTKRTLSKCVTLCLRIHPPALLVTWSELSDWAFSTTGSAMMPKDPSSTSPTTTAVVTSSWLVKFKFSAHPPDSSLGRTLYLVSLVVEFTFVSSLILSELYTVMFIMRWCRYENI